MFILSGKRGVIASNSARLAGTAQELLSARRLISGTGRGAVRRAAQSQRATVIVAVVTVTTLLRLRPRPGEKRAKIVYTCRGSRFASGNVLRSGRRFRHSLLALAPGLLGSA